MAWNKDTDIEKIREYNREYYSKVVKKKREEKNKNKPKGKLVTCPICGIVFHTEKRNEKYCCEACKVLATKMRQAKYRNTPEFKEKMKEYRKTDTYKKTVKKYRQSEKGKATLKKYQQSEKGKKATKKSYEKFKANGYKSTKAVQEEQVSN